MYKLRVCSGFGNRLKPIASLLGHGLPFMLDWSFTSNMAIGDTLERHWITPWYGDFNYFFKNEIPRFSLGEDCQTEYRLAKLEKSTIDNGPKPFVTWRFVYDRTFDAYVQPGGQWAHRPFGIDQMYEWTPDDVAQVLVRGFAQLEPVDEVTTIVRQLTDELHANRVKLGLHVRRRYSATAYDSLEPYHDAIKAERGRKFLFVTDDEDTLRVFEKAYPRQIIAFDKSFNHTDTMKSRSCLIEMLLLSYCERFKYTEKSTFSECAYWFNMARLNSRAA